MKVEVTTLTIGSKGREVHIVTPAGLSHADRIELIKANLSVSTNTAIERLMKEGGTIKGLAPVPTTTEELCGEAKASPNMLQ